jgi:hypothetical protein
MEIMLTIGAFLLGGLIIYLAMLGQEMSAAERRTRNWAEEPKIAPESYKGKCVSVRFVKKDGTLRHMRDFIVLHITRYKSGKVLISGLEATDQGWAPKSFCQHQLLAMKVVDLPSDKALAEAKALFRELSDPNNC